jgi:hypothetical protein
MDTNAYIERIDPDRRMPDLISGACAVHVHHVACQQLGIVEPKGSANAKPVSLIGFKALRDTLDLLHQHANALQKRKRSVGSSALVVIRPSWGLGST